MGVDVFGIVGTVQAGQFEVESAVAEGGFAVVYRALHRAFRAPIALKCLKIPGSMTSDQRESFLEKFRAEAELLFRLSSITPHVVRPLQVGTLDLPGRFVPFIALEWLEGESLDSIRQKRAAAGKAPMKMQRIVKLFAPVARALTIAHRLPSPEGSIAVIHCDLKPENIYVAKSASGDVVKILDFGIARVKDVTSAIAGRTSGSGGSASAFTPGYGAPEQWDPNAYGQTGPWTDVWGLAITIVELALGRAAIDGALGAMMSLTVDPHRRPTPRALGVQVNDAVEAAMARALAVDPKLRTQDIRAFWTELELAVGETPSLLEDQRVEPLRSDPPPSGRFPSLPPLPPPGGLPNPAMAFAQEPAIRAPLYSEIDPTPLGASPYDSSQPPPGASHDPRGDLDPSLSMGLVAQPARPRPLPPRAFAHGPVNLADESSSVFDKLAVPLKLVGAALVIAIADQVYTHVTTTQLTLGPARPFWLSAGLVALAVVMAFVRLMSD